MRATQGRETEGRPATTPLRSSSRSLEVPSPPSPPLGSGPQPMHHPRERDRLAQVGEPADPRDRALESQPEARVHEGAVLAQVEVPAVGLLREPLLPDAVDQLVVVVLALAPADDLAVPL